MPLATISASAADDGFADTLPTSATIGSSGIVLGDGNTPDSFGVKWKWNPTNAQGSKPAPREETGDRPNSDGQWNATRFFQSRNLPIPGFCRAPDHATLHKAEQRLRDAVALTNFQLLISQPAFEGYAMVRQSGELLWTEDGSPRTPHATFSIGLVADDPLVYSTQLRTFTLFFPASTGGMSWVSPGATWVAPGASWVATSVLGSTTLVNPSSRPVPLLLRLANGAVTSASVVVQQGLTTQVLNLSRPSTDPGSILGNSAETLDIDTGRHSVLLQGNASRRSWGYGTWPLIPPGTSTLSIAGIGAASTATAAGSFRAVRL